MVWLQVVVEGFKRVRVRVIGEWLRSSLVKGKVCTFFNLFEILRKSRRGHGRGEVSAVGGEKEDFVDVPSTSNEMKG
jgi:hypothetical protein